MNWDQVLLGELCTIQSGSANTQDADPNGAYLFFDRSKQPKRSNRFLFDCEALIIAGEGAEFRPKRVNGKFDLHQRAYAIFGFGKRLLGDYMFYYLEHVHRYFQEVAVGATVKSLRQRHFENLPVFVPPLEEQQRIVAMLDQAFTALDSAGALAEANLADAEALFDGWLTAVFHDHPLEWSTSKLRDLCHQITVGHVGPMADRYSSGGTPFLRSQNVRPFRIDLADVKFIDDAFRSELKKSELRPGDVAIVRTGYPGTAAVIPDDLPLANCADLVIARPKAEVHPEFLAMFLNSSFGKKMVAGNSVGAAQKHFNVGAAKEVDFAFPELEEQRAIVNQMKTMRGHLGRLRAQCRAKIDDLTGLRQALLQQTFGGELI